MIILDHNEAYPGHKPGTAIAIGYFDGVHLGHQAVIQAAKEHAGQHGLDLAVFTFLLPEKTGIKGRRLLTAGQKHAALASLGVEYCFEPVFESFCQLSPTDFFEKMLLGQYKAKALFCGEDFAFGAGRAGNVTMLGQLCKQAGVALGIAPTALYKDEEVSSSRIRLALSAGQIPDVNAMLGRPYEICLPVRHGEKLGRTLGFPTINQIYPPEMQPPMEGIYITETDVNGKAWPSATGYGNRPTVGGVGDTCETFIPGFAGNLYGKEITVRFFKRICGNIKFATLEDLRQAVQGWAKQAAEYFEEKDEK